jgi:hypothetical protein
MIASGTRIGVYEIVAMLGAGGMGEEGQSPLASHQSSVIRRPTTDELTTERLRTGDLRLMTTSPCR